MPITYNFNAVFVKLNDMFTHDASSHKTQTKQKNNVPNLTKTL